MKVIEVRCDICGMQLKSADNPAQAKRNIGFHKRIAHGIHGAAATMEGRRAFARERHWQKKGYSPARIEELRAQYEARQSATPTSEGLVRKTKKATDAVPLPLTECPLCHARFYYTAQPKDS